MKQNTKEPKWWNFTKECIHGRKKIDWRGLVTPVKLAAVPEQGWKVVDGIAVRVWK